jgi:flagellar hook assembly protein FlgD
MTVESVTSSLPSSLYTGTPVEPASRTQVMDGEMFLRLLVTQLTNQDPSSPMDTNAMIAQTTQLAMMEQLTVLSDTGTEAFALNMRQAATALIGQSASYEDADGATVTGVVTKVSFDGVIPHVTIGGKDVGLDSITTVIR